MGIQMNTTCALAASNSLTDLAARVQQEHKAVAAALKHSVERAMAAGDLLLEAKSQISHGQWRSWLSDYCGLSERTAQRYMRLARNRAQIESNTTCVSDLSINAALTMLVSPKDPDSLAANALAQAAGVLSDAEEILGIEHNRAECRKRQAFINEAIAATHRINEILERRPDLGDTVERIFTERATLVDSMADAYQIHVLCDRHEAAYEIAVKYRDICVDCLHQVEAAE